MKIVKKSQAEVFKAGDECTVFEYPMEYKDINGAVAKINGRYPSKGITVNEISRELGYVINGQGKITIDNKEIQLNKGDLICIDPGEKFYWEGNMELFIPCTPAWTPEQHKFIE